MKKSPRGLVVITGGAGFIGSHLAERHLRAGDSVLAIDDLSTGRAGNLSAFSTHPSFKFRKGRLSEIPQLARTIKDARLIYHLAAAVGVELVMKSPVYTIHNNLKETEIILEAASKAAVPVLLTSTSEVYGKSKKKLFSESDDLLIGPPTLGRWSYACSKLMDEFLALAYARERGVPVIIARLFNTVGPRQSGKYGMVFPRFISSALKGEPLQVYGSGKQTRCFCFINDTVEALFKLAHTQAAWGQIVNIGTNQEISILALARLIIRELDSSSKIKLIPYSRNFASGFEDMQRRKPNVAKLKKLTGFTPRTSLVRAIQMTAASLGKGVP